MPTEAAFYRQLRTAAKRVRPELRLTRIENSVGQGIPDLMICDERGLLRHRHSDSWILAKQGRDKVFLYHACQALELKQTGLKLGPAYEGKVPFDWNAILGLICPI